MADLPENLQIKRELSPPSTPEDKSPKSIKAKLNLHVKRRLQDFNQTCSKNASIVKNTEVVADIKQEQQVTETIRQKRPYHKRIDKNKPLDNTQSTSTNEAQSAQRTKYKHKIKQIVSSDYHDIAGNNSTEDNSVNHNAVITAGTISAGDEDDGGHDNELKPVREKEKCPDVLGMVLSMKKRSLMQDPEVQNFLKEIMDVIKS